jgi:uncharacterized protein involved in tellurium resistance
MPELKSKTTLEEKGDEAHISVEQLMVTLSWTEDVDLDLMAFYKADDGRKGGVFTDELPGGDLGSLNEFPFIQHSGDEGVGAVGGDNEETVRVTKLDDMESVHIITLNYTDAANKNDSNFAKYDAQVTVMDDRGEAVEVPLDSETLGTVAHIAEIDNSSPMGAKLINRNEIMGLGQFVQDIPAGDAITK